MHPLQHLPCDGSYSVRSSSAGKLFSTGVRHYGVTMYPSPHSDRVADGPLNDAENTLSITVGVLAGRQGVFSTANRTILQLPMAPSTSHRHFLC